jgi:8-oxo-dGTP pyrophosphatase MutT (NUDIX family)
MTEKEYYKKSAWVHIENRHILVGRSKGNAVFFIPGGGPEENETPEQALVRELKEELSIDIKQETIQHLGTFEAPSFEFPDTISVRMDCFTATYSGELIPSSEVVEIAWFKYKDKDRTSAVDKEVIEYLKQMNLID